MSENERSVQFKPTAEDYRRVLIWYQWRRVVIIMAVVLVIVFFLAFYLTNSKPSDPNRDIRPAALAALVFIPFFILGSLYWGIRRQAKKIASISETTKFI